MLNAKLQTLNSFNEKYEDKVLQDQNLPPVVEDVEDSPTLNSVEYLQEPKENPENHQKSENLESMLQSSESEEVRILCI